MSETETRILCFQHCDKNKKIFCFKLPELCPLCKANILTKELLLPPFKIPCPFTDAMTHKCCVVIKPTKGDFLHYYRNSAALHIGVTNSKGQVYEFDENGVQIGSSTRWQQCLAVPLLNRKDPTWRDYWDYVLGIVSLSYSSLRYDVQELNCYTFVLSFLRTLEVPELKEALESKTKFCARFLVPRTTTAAKYIAYYRRILKEGSCVV